MRLRLAVVDLAAQHLAATGAAGAVLAAVGQRQALAQGGIEQGFVGLDRKLAAARLDSDLIAHGFLLFPYRLG